jgi:predicted aspartyl protease
VTLTLNGVEKPFLLDTGGAATQISRATAQELKLPIRELGGKMMDL